MGVPEYAAAPAALAVLVFVPVPGLSRDLAVIPSSALPLPAVRRYTISFTSTPVARRMISRSRLIRLPFTPEPRFPPLPSTPPTDVDVDIAAPAPTPDSSGDDETFKPEATRLVALSLRILSAAVLPSAPDILDTPSTDPSSVAGVRVLVSVVPNSDPNPVLATGTLDECPCDARRGTRRELPGVGIGPSAGADRPSCLPSVLACDCDVLPVEDSGKCDAEIDPFPLRIPSADALAAPDTEAIPEGLRAAGDAVRDAVGGIEVGDVGELARPDVGLVARFTGAGLVARAALVVGLVVREVGEAVRSRSRALDADVDAVGLRARRGGDMDRASVRPAAGAELDPRLVVDADVDA